MMNTNSMNTNSMNTNSTNDINRLDNTTMVMISQERTIESLKETIKRKNRTIESMMTILKKYGLEGEIRR